MCDVLASVQTAVVRAIVQALDGSSDEAHGISYLNEPLAARIEKAMTQTVSIRPRKPMMTMSPECDTVWSPRRSASCSRTPERRDSILTTRSLTSARVSLTPFCAAVNVAFCCFDCSAADVSDLMIDFSDAS